MRKLEFHRIVASFQLSFHATTLVCLCLAPEAKASMNAIEIARRVYFRNDNNIWAESSAYNSCENLVRNAILSSIFFTSLYPLITWVLRNIFPHRIRNLDNDEKRFKELVGYLYSLVHHLVVVPWALMALYNECLKSDEEWRLVNFALEYSFLPPYCFGYLMGDLIMYAAPRAREGRLDMLTHHVLGLGMILCACLTTPPVCDVLFYDV